MKTLKKTLCVVLAVVMAVGTLAITASATDFTDDANITYDEAVEVLTGLGIINGKENNRFDPEGTLTRAEGAKIITYTLLTPTTADILKASSDPFDDVAASNWAAGSVEYCVSQGIIAGVGNNNFDPQGTLTGVAFAKMFLVALGIEGQFENTTAWDTNVVLAARRAGLDDGMTGFDYYDAITREEACQMALNALFTGGESVTKNSVKYVVKDASGNNQIYDTWTDAQTALAVSGSSYQGTVTVTETTEEGSIADEVFNLTERTAGVTDDFKRPATEYVQNNKVIATFPKAATVTYTVPVAPAKIFADLGLTANTTADLYVNGANATTQAINYNDTANLSASGYGVLTEVYYDGTSIDIIVIDTYYDVVSSVAPATAITPETVTLTNTSAADKTFAISGLKAGDKVLVTATAAEVQSVTKVTPITVTATSYSGSTSFTANGVTYQYNKNNNGAINDFTAHEVILDKYGYVINVSNPASVANYAVVLSGTTVTATWPSTTTTYKAQILLPDGNVTIVDAAANYNSDAGKIMTYSVSNGIYTFTAPAPAAVTTGSNAIDVNNGSSAFTWNSITAYADAQTVYLVRTGQGTTVSPYIYTAYVGFSNVPSLSGASVTGQYVSSNGFVDVIYITGATLDGISSTDVIFVPGIDTSVTTPTGTSYTTNAVVNGQITTLVLDNHYAAGVYGTRVANTNGTYALANSTGTPVTNIAPYVANSGVVTVNGTPIAHTADCTVYTYNATTGAITASSLSAISATTTGFYTTNTNGQITALFLVG